MGKGALEVALFVGVSNSLWMTFPPMGMYECFCMLRVVLWKCFSDHMIFEYNFMEARIKVSS